MGASCDRFSLPGVRRGIRDTRAPRSARPETSKRHRNRSLLLFLGNIRHIDCLSAGYRLFQISDPSALPSEEPVSYFMIATLEESLEMAGLIVFIWTLLEYCRETFSELRIVIGKD